MAETALPNELQIRRRQLENELASLSQKEMALKGELKILEKAIAAELEEAIKAKKLTLSGMESQKNGLEKKLREMQGNRLVLRKPKDQCANSKGDESDRQDQTEEDYIQISLVES
jgi:hypothetical protein